MEDSKKKVSFRQKNATVCPVCGFSFYREEMLTGGGRLIAGKLTDELRRMYEKNTKYGQIYPMAYALTVCPSCYYAAYPKDFPLLSAEEVQKLKHSAQARANTIKKFFPGLNFADDRDLAHAAASMMLAVDIYAIRAKSVAPTFKQAVSAIRAAWLFSDLAQLHPQAPYKKISDFFYAKAYGLYGQVLELLQNGREPAEAAGNMGPDMDKNWGYDGILYLYAKLTLKVGSKEPDLAKRIANVELTKRYLSRIFGMGKSSKDKPSVIIDMTRDLYDKMNEMLQKWNEEIAASQPPATSAE